MNTDHTTSALVLSGPDARRPPTTMGEWRKQILDFGNWTRLGMIMSAVFYLEIFIMEAVTLALRSDPFVLYGLPHQLDGLRVIKTGKRLNFDAEARSCCTNTWDARRDSFLKLFGATPSAISTYMTERGLSRCPRLLDHAFPGGCDEQRPSQTARGKISDGLECQHSHPYSAALQIFAQPIVAVTWDNGISHDRA